MSLPISVIIPTFNRREQVGRAIESVLQQTQPPREVLVIDDGSNDGTSDSLVEHFADSIHVIRQENRGVSAARNLGLKHSSQAWIALLDSDDLWLPNKLERQWQELQRSQEWSQTPLRILHCDEIWIRNGRRVNAMKKHQKRGGRIFEHCLPLCCISPSAVLLHKSLFDDFGSFDESLPACEDYDLWLRLCAHEDVLFLDEALLEKYGGHDDQLSRRFWGMDRFRIQALEKLLRMPALPLSTQERQAAHKTLITKLRIYIGGAEKRGRNDEDLQEHKNKLVYWQGEDGVTS